MNKQELFDKAYVGVIAQGRPAYILNQGDVNCVYRDNDGLMCAVGHVMKGLFEDDDPIWDGMTSASHIHLKGPIDSVQEKFLRGNIGLFADYIQSIHDRGAEVYDGERDADKFIKDFKRQMKDVAYQHSLTIPTMAT